jgi:hypothetical protein
MISSDSLVVVVLLFGLMLAVPIAIGTCALIGWVMLIVNRPTIQCPTCHALQMRSTNAIRETYLTGRGTGQFYVCEACSKRWFWSNDDRTWELASKAHYDWAFEPRD